MRQGYCDQSEKQYTFLVIPRYVATKNIYIVLYNKIGLKLINGCTCRWNIVDTACKQIRPSIDDSGPEWFFGASSATWRTLFLMHLSLVYLFVITTDALEYNHHMNTCNANRFATSTFIIFYDYKLYVQRFTVCCCERYAIYSKVRNCFVYFYVIVSFYRHEKSW